MTQVNTQRGFKTFLFFFPAYNLIQLHVAASHTWLEEHRTISFKNIIITNIVIHTTN